MQRGRRESGFLLVTDEIEWGRLALLKEPGLFGRGGAGIARPRDHMNQRWRADRDADSISVSPHRDPSGIAAHRDSRQRQRYGQKQGGQSALHFMGIVLPAVILSLFNGGAKTSPMVALSQSLCKPLHGTAGSTKPGLTGQPMRTHIDFAVATKYDAF